MKIHILGICGTFMAGVALLARQSGHEVSGSDMNIYPPMSTQLAAQGIKLMAGYDPSHIDHTIDCVIVGNVISRGNPLIESILERKIPYYSGPQWLAQTILKDRWVLAVAGTHGKTTTTSMLAWMLDYVGYQPGFLVGGVPENFGVSSRLGSEPYFVIEADEYDTAFFDKRSKFIHYHPQTLILNNLEFDHADIFSDLEAVKKQFQYLVRTVPGNGLIVHQAQDANVASVLEQGCWTPTTTFSLTEGNWQAKLIKTDGSKFDIYYDYQLMGQVDWNLLGLHNVQNALAALAAAHHVKAPIALAIESLSVFKNVKRRLEIKGKVRGVTIYDDFAHHPTAIATTLAGLRSKIGQQRMIVVLEFGSYTMRTGVHAGRLQEALVNADLVVCKRPEVDSWGLESILKTFSQPAILYNDVNALVEGLTGQVQPNDHIVVMSNSGFDGIHEKLTIALKNNSKEKNASH